MSSKAFFARRMAAIPPRAQLELPAAVAPSLDELVVRGLDGLARVAPYDLATVFELDGAEIVVRIARGPLALRRALGAFRRGGGGLFALSRRSAFFALFLFLGLWWLRGHNGHTSGDRFPMFLLRLGWLRER